MDYHRGEMDISEQERTFSGFMRTTVWFSAHTAILLIFLTLHFAVGVSWFLALGVAFVVGVLIGLGLGLRGAWYAVVTGMAVVGGLIGVLSALVGALAG